MSAVPQREIVSYTHFQSLREGKDVISQEANALRDIADRLDHHFCQAVDLITECRGRVIVTGIGKAGLIGQKIAATLSSTGTRAQFLHPAEAIHGDLGCLSPEDLVLALSNSGETEELCRLLPVFARIGTPVIAVTSIDSNTLARHSRVSLCLGRLQEAGLHGLAPSTSTTAMLALGDALALVVARKRGFTPETFALFHPGGSLGRRLTHVGDMMRRGNDVRVASQDATVREVLTRLSRPGRRSGAVMLVDESGRLRGLFTDSDLARLLESRSDHRLDTAIRDVMTRHPTTVAPTATLSEVVELLALRKISEVPVVDTDSRPLGLIDITDVIGLLPAAESGELESAENSA